MEGVPKGEPGGGVPGLKVVGAPGAKVDGGVKEDGVPELNVDGVPGLKVLPLLDDDGKELPPMRVM